jgi:hypothetical protein
MRKIHLISLMAAIIIPCAILRMIHSETTIKPLLGGGGVRLGDYHEPLQSKEMLIFSGSGKKVFVVCFLDPKFVIEGTDIRVGSSRTQVNSTFGQGRFDATSLLIGDGGEVFVYEGFFVRYTNDIVDMIGVCRTDRQRS